MSHKITFILERSWKNMYFHPPATYDVVSRNHSNWKLLNLSQNVCEGWTNSYWSTEVLSSSKKNSEKPESLNPWFNAHPAAQLSWKLHIPPPTINMDLGKDPLATQLGWIFFFDHLLGHPDI